MDKQTITRIQAVTAMVVLLMIVLFRDRPLIWYTIALAYGGYHIRRLVRGKRETESQPPHKDNANTTTHGDGA